MLHLKKMESEKMCKSIHRKIRFEQSTIEAVLDALKNMLQLQDRRTEHPEVKYTDGGLAGIIHSIQFVYKTK